MTSGAKGIQAWDGCELAVAVEGRLGGWTWGIRFSGLGRWVHVTSWYGKLALGASKGLMIRTFAHDADMLLAYEQLLYQDHLSQIWLCEITGLRGVLLSSTPLLALAGF